MTPRPPTLPGYSAHVFAATDIRVTGGANVGDVIGPSEATQLGDVYQLGPGAQSRRIMLTPGRAADSQMVGPGSEVAEAGDAVTLLSLLTLMAPDGDLVEVLVIDIAGHGTMALPLTPMAPRTDYTLIAARDDPGEVRIADIVCVSFASGTLITRPGGAQTPIDQLTPGDTVLTRDHGPQAIRWIGKATFRAIGGFAPIVITAGTLGNRQDLVVSPHHRIFIYQRGPQRIGGTAEILVQAKHLVDGDLVRRREGGFVDYLSLVFDHHEIIYAEGVPAESLMVTEATLQVLPEPLADEVRRLFPGLAQRQHFGTEVSRTMLDEAGRDRLLRKPSKG